MRFLSAAMRGVRRGSIVALQAIPPLVRDLIGLVGASMIIFGVWQMHQPSAWIVAGSFLVATAWRLAVRAQPQGEAE